MQLQSLQQYIESITLGKKEYLFIKKFCIENEIEILDFFKQQKKYNYRLIESFFIVSLSKSIQDEEMISYFLEKQLNLPEINFKKIINDYNATLTYQHLLGVSKEEELSFLLKEKSYNKIFIFLKDNPDYIQNKQIEDLVITDFSYIEKFEKYKIPFNKQSYNTLDVIYNNVLGHKEYNNNFLKLDKFYGFIEKNKDKISLTKRKEYLEAIINYGALTVHDFKKQSYWDYVFIPLIHQKEYPDFTRKNNFFNNLIKYKEQIFSETEPYNSLKVLPSLNAKNKIDIVLNYIKNYTIENYDYTSCAIFNHFINEVDEKFINDFFKLGIQSGYIFSNSLKDEYINKYNKNEEYKKIEYYSKSLDNETIRNSKEIIAKQILRHKYMFKDMNVLKNYITLSKEILDKKEFILSLKDEELTSMMAVLKENNLPKTAARILEIRLEEKMPAKLIKVKQLKI